MRIKVFYCLVWSNMDIQKCNVEKNCEWSAAVVKGLAVTLGLSALVSLEGCAGNVAKTSNDLTESVQLSSSSDLSSSSTSDSISSSSSNDFGNIIEMIEDEKNQEWLGELFGNKSKEEIIEDFKKYVKYYFEHKDNQEIIDIEQ